MTALGREALAEGTGLLRRYAHVEVTGPVQRLRSNFLHGTSTCPSGLIQRAGDVPAPVSGAS